MAIKINNTTVIDDGRNISGVGLTATAIYANGTVGTAGSVLASTGSGIEWIPAPTGGGGGGGGSGTFDTGITTSIYVSVTAGIGTAIAGFTTEQANNDIFIGPGIAYSFPSTSGKKYVIESIHVANSFGNELYLSGRQDYDGGSNVPIAQRVIVPYQGATELLEQPIIANPSDVLRLQALSGIGTTAGGVDGGLDAFIVYSEKDDTDYIGVGKTIADGSDGTEIFTSTTNPSVIQSIRIINYSLSSDQDVSLAIYNGGTVGQISTTGIRQGYFIYNITVPVNSTIEICEKPKYLAAGQTIIGIGKTTFNEASICISGKYIV